MLGGHQHLPGLVPGRDHLLHVPGRRGQGLLADDVLARLQGRDGQRGVVVIGGTDVDDVEVFVLEQFGWVRCQLPHPVLLPPVLQDLRIDIRAGDELSVLRCIPAGDVGPGDSSDADDANFQFAAHGALSVVVREQSSEARHSRLRVLRPQMLRAYSIRLIPGCATASPGYSAGPPYRQFFLRRWMRS